MTSKLKIEKQSHNEIIIICDTQDSRDRFYKQLRNGKKFMEKLL